MSLQYSIKTNYTNSLSISDSQIKAILQHGVQEIAVYDKKTGTHICNLDASEVITKADFRKTENKKTGKFENTKYRVYVWGI